MKYNKAIVVAWMTEQGIPRPETEYKFHETRKWKMDFAWPHNFSDTACFLDEKAVAYYTTLKPVCLEVQGGIFIQGRHSRGAALIKEWEKLNEAACLGYRILYCQPSDLCTTDMANTIKRALGIT